MPPGKLENRQLEMQKVKKNARVTAYHISQRKAAGVSYAREVRHGPARLGGRVDVARPARVVDDRRGVDPLVERREGRVHAALVRQRYDRRSVPREPFNQTVPKGCHD